MAIRVAFALTLAGAVASSARCGQVLERIVCAGDSSVAYAAYIPSGYDPARRWPILYCFDPGGRGERPLALFRDAAERGGLVIASAHGFSSSSSSPERTGAIIAGIWNDTHRRFPIDLTRVFATGFSGGGRVAWLLDALTKDVPFAGIIEVGAGLPWSEPPRDYDPAGPAFCGMSGRLDFNYYEVVSLRNRLRDAGGATRLAVFDGGHAWPPEQECGRALDWMRIVTEHRAASPVDTVLAARYAADEAARAGAAREEGRILDAVEILDSLVLDCRRLGLDGPAVAAAEAEAARLRAGEAYATERERRERLDGETRVAILAAAARLDSLAGENRPKQLPSQTELFKSFGLAPGDGAETLPADAGEEALARRRLADAVYARAAGPVSVRLLRRGDLPPAILVLRLAVALAPDRPTAWYNLSAAQARAGDRVQAIDSLGRAVACGFEDAEWMREDPDLAPLHSDPAFQRLIERAAGRAR